LGRLNLSTAIISLMGSVVWFVIGANVTGLFWLVCSLAWLALAIVGLLRSANEPHPTARLMRRLSRMLIWG